MTSTATRAFYLTSGIEPIYALFDDPAGPTDGILDPAIARNAAASGGPSAVGRAIGAPTVGVLLCPLFGNDDLCAYRARREWAKTLAAALTLEPGVARTITLSHIATGSDARAVGKLTALNLRGNVSLQEQPLGT